MRSLGLTRAHQSSTFGRRRDCAPGQLQRISAGRVNPPQSSLGIGTRSASAILAITSKLGFRLPRSMPLDVRLKSDWGLYNLAVTAETRRRSGTSGASIVCVPCLPFLKLIHSLRKDRLRRHNPRVSLSVSLTIRGAGSVEMHALPSCKRRSPMTTPLDMPVHLQARELLPIEDGAGLEVKCLRGNLWITQAGDAEDKIVRGGESFVLDRPGLSLVTALLGPALLIVQPGRIPAAHEFRAAA